MSEMMKVNTALTSLNLWSVEEGKGKRYRIRNEKTNEW